MNIDFEAQLLKKLGCSVEPDNLTDVMSLLWVQVALGTLSLAAPLWVAWLATRQIAQRFRLAEDYSFKASLATAYEGYRREASRIDPDFEKDLFGSALRHLDQEPLRFMVQDVNFFSKPVTCPTIAQPQIIQLGRMASSRLACRSRAW